MPHTATFTLNGKKYDVLDASYAFYQAVDDNGKPVSDVKGGTVSIAVRSTKDTDLVKWMIDPTKKYDGEINIFSEDDKDQSMKKWSFKNAFCVGHSESFSSSGLGMMEKIVVSAEKLSIGSEEHENHWVTN